MMKWIMVIALLVLATNAIAEVLTETFDDPLGGWKTRWLGVNSNMTNYYVCTGGGDENQRGNNPCGLWICDADQDYMTAIVTFDPSFAPTVTHFEIGVQAFTDSHLVIYDKDGGTLLTATLTVNYNSPYGCYTTAYAVDSTNGVGGFSILPDGGGQIEGNTAVDNFSATVGEPTPVASKSWGGIKALYR